MIFHRTNLPNDTFSIPLDVSHTGPGQICRPSRCGGSVPNYESVGENCAPYVVYLLYVEPCQTLLLKDIPSRVKIFAFPSSHRWVLMNAWSLRIRPIDGNIKESRLWSFVILDFSAFSFTEAQSNWRAIDLRNIHNDAACQTARSGLNV